MTTIEFNWTRINNDTNGNPRYVIHFLTMLTEAEKAAYSDNKYNDALFRARKIGGRKFHNKQYGGGIVFQEYSVPSLEKRITKLLDEAENNETTI